jgi:hypothetical protein
MSVQKHPMRRIQGKQSWLASVRKSPAPMLICRTLPAALVAPEIGAVMAGLVAPASACAW